MATDDLCYLTATEAIERFRAKTLSPVELMSAVIARSETVKPQGQRLHLHLLRARAGAGAGGRASLCLRRRDRGRWRGCRWSSRDFHALKGENHHLRLAHLCEPRARFLGADGGAPARCGRDHARADHNARDGPRAAHAQRALGHHAQPVEPGFLARRLLGRRGCCHRDRHDHAGRRHRRRRLNPHPPPARAGIFGFKPPFGRKPDRPRPPARIPAPLRPADPQRRRRRSDAERDGGSPPGRHLLAPPQAGNPGDAGADQGVEDRVLHGPRLHRGGRGGAEEHARRTSRPSATSAAPSRRWTSAGT